jgi:hypothetical protein
VIEQILANEEEHASDLADLLYINDPKTGEAEAQDPGTTPLQAYGGESKDRTVVKQQETGDAEKHNKDKTKILKQLRKMGDKKNKPAA